MPTLVSVLMPVYNAAATLAACMDSILAQTCRDFEVIAVDDGSTDEGPALLARYAAQDGRVKPLSLPHRGIVAALNRGLAECGGAYVARMDADDLMHPGRLEKQLGYLAAHRECRLAGTLVRPYGIGKALSPGALRYHEWLNSLVSDADIKRELFVDSPIAHSTFLARRDFFTGLGGYRDCAWAEDYDLLFRAVGEGAVLGKVPEVLLERGDRPERLTRVDPRYKRKTMFAAKAHYLARGCWLKGKDGVVIAGTGPSGRIVAAALLREGVPIRCFVDHRAGPPGRTVMGLPAQGFPEGIPEEFLAEHAGAFLALCIGEAAARGQVSARLDALGLKAGRDYARFI